MTERIKVKAGSPNIRVNRLECERQAFDLGMTKEQMEELSDTELQHWVLLKSCKDY